MSTVGKRILIAEDESSIAQALKLKLDNLGHEVRVVNDGGEALVLLEQNAYDLLLLDIMMPSKNGFEVMEFLKMKENKTPIIVSSNLSQEIDKQKATELGASDFFVKSNTSLSEIVNKINEHLN